MRMKGDCEESSNHTARAGRPTLRQHPGGWARRRGHGTHRGLTRIFTVATTWAIDPGRDLHIAAAGSLPGLCARARAARARALRMYRDALRMHAGAPRDCPVSPDLAGTQRRRGSTLHRRSMVQYMRLVTMLGLLSGVAHAQCSADADCSLNGTTAPRAQTYASSIVA